MNEPVLFTTDALDLTPDETVAGFNRLIAARRQALIEKLEASSLRQIIRCPQGAARAQC